MNESRKNGKTSLTIHRKYKYFYSSAQTAQDGRFALTVNVMRNSVIWSQTKEAVLLIVIHLMLGIALLLNFLQMSSLMENRLLDKARKNLLPEELSDGGMCEELKEYMHHFNIFLFFLY